MTSMRLSNVSVLNLYWTDTFYNRIKVARLDNPDNRKVLVSRGLHEPRAIVLDANEGIITFIYSVFCNPDFITMALSLFSPLDMRTYLLSVVFKAYDLDAVVECVCSESLLDRHVLQPHQGRAARQPQ